MSGEQNKAVVSRFIEEVWHEGKIAVLDEVLDPNVVDHNPASGQAAGLEGQRQVAKMFRAAFPDLQIKIDLLFANGELTADRWTAIGTHRGELFGIAPTGKQIKITGIDICRLRNGKIVEVWHQENTLTMMQRLGVVPAPGQAAPAR